MSKGSSKEEKNEKDKKTENKAPEPQDKVPKSEIEALEEGILKKYTSKLEEPAVDPFDAPEEKMIEMKSLNEEILKRYASISEDRMPEQEEVQEPGSISSEERDLNGGTLKEEDSNTEQDWKDQRTDTSSLKDENIEMDISEEVELVGMEGAVDPSEDEVTEESREEDILGENDHGEDTPFKADVSLLTKVPAEPQQDLPASPEEVIETLRSLREDVGQISELSSEEGNIVEAFSISFLKLMESFAKSLPVNVSILPKEIGAIERANVIPKGELVVLFKDGRMESVNLSEPENRDLLVDVVSDVMPKFNTLIANRRSKIERRITFLSDITKELQTIADSLVTIG